jgi:hypothetical protein
MKNIKLGFLIVVGVLLLDSCLVIPRHRTAMERRMYRSGLYIYPRVRLYKRQYIPNYHPQPRRYYNPTPPKPREK